MGGVDAGTVRVLIPQFLKYVLENRINLDEASGGDCMMLKFTSNDFIEFLKGKGIEVSDGSSRTTVLHLFHNSMPKLLRELVGEGSIKHFEVRRIRKWHTYRVVYVIYLTPPGNCMPQDIDGNVGYREVLNFVDHVLKNPQKYIANVRANNGNVWLKVHVGHFTRFLRSKGYELKTKRQRLSTVVTFHIYFPVIIGELIEKGVVKEISRDYRYTGPYKKRVIYLVRI